MQSPSRREPGLSGQLGGRPLRRVVYSADAIQRRVAELGREIADCYTTADELLVLGLLKGSFIFVADLVRAIPLPVQVDFLTASSYGAGRVSSGDIQLRSNPATSIEGRNIVLVEDIVDSGNTIRHVMRVLADQAPASLELCALLHKRTVTLPHEARWVGFDAPGEFLVGYGLDFAEDFRHLPCIGAI